MTPDPEMERDIKGLLSAVAALQAGERHSAEDRELIRSSLRETETRIIAKVVEVDEHCAKRFRDAAETFTKDQTSKRGVTVAWIGGVFLLLTSTINTIAGVVGSGP